VIQTLGVIGGGQLGRMLALDAKRMGYYVVTLDPAEHSPCGQVADEQIVASYDDLSAIDRLGARSDVVTYEFENVDIAAIARLERSGRAVMPGSAVLGVTQDRVLEKQFVNACGIATAAFAAIDGHADLASAAAAVGFPAVLKLRLGGYDGKGQWQVGSAAALRAAFDEGGGKAAILERKVPFVRELSVVATRNGRDDAVAYPPAENVHHEGILMTSIAPARVDAQTAARATSAAMEIGRRLGIVGTYCVEFFHGADGELLVNEIAPRPHNSGHYTIDATPCSQYEQHIRAICGVPLSPPRLLTGAVMVNILGKGEGNTLDGVADLLADPSVVLHIYGKRHAPNRRKMGHFTMLTDAPVTDAAIARAATLAKKLHWKTA
jgi:5-(carboxyamino)imidazole ribonucleotide synthase